VTANNLVTNILSSRMTRIKGCLPGPFIYGIYGHNVVGRSVSHNGIIGYGYKDNTYGLVLGVDKIWVFANEKYFRLGTILGYVQGKTIPSWEAFTKRGRTFSSFHVDPRQFSIDFGHDAYAVRLFGAYELFNDKCLKTNIGIILGYNYGRDKYQAGNFGMSWNNVEMIIKFISHSASLEGEFIKNLYAYNGYQFGLWIKANYTYIFENAYLCGFLYGGNYNAYPTEKVNHDFFATIVGLNMEKEAFKHVDKKLTFSLKAGWECRLIHNIYDAFFHMRNKCPRKDAAIISLGASQKLSNHWSIVGSYTGRFNKDLLAHNLAGGVEYSF
jgi:hypothetical protein